MPRGYKEEESCQIGLAMLQTIELFLKALLSSNNIYTFPAPDGCDGIDREALI
jgi:hypothetical protein